MVGWKESGTETSSYSSASTNKESGFSSFCATPGVRTKRHRRKGKKLNHNDHYCAWFDLVKFTTEYFINLGAGHVPGFPQLASHPDNGNWKTSCIADPGILKYGKGADTAAT